MKKTYRHLAVAILFITGVAIGCAPETKSTSPAIAPGDKVAGVEQKKTGWQEQWDKLVLAAQTEGKAYVYASALIPKTRDAYISAFKKKYGIDLEFIVSTPADIVTRLRTEAQAGIRLADIGFGGVSTVSNSLKPLGILDSLEPLLILPEVTGAAAWRNNQLPFFDKDKTTLSITLFRSLAVVYNTELVKPGEITSYLDLLQPKWKGRIAIHDPTRTGSGATWFGVVVQEVFGKERGVPFMRDLVKTDPFVTYNHRLMVESLARGKYAVGLGAEKGTVSDFIKNGAPLAFHTTLKEPFHLSPGWSSVFVYKDRPHPNATQVFVNWALTREGMDVMVQSSGNPPTRKDVPVQGIEPELVPGDRDIALTEEYYAGAPEMATLAMELFSPLLK